MLLALAFLLAKDPHCYCIASWIQNHIFITDPLRRIQLYWHSYCLIALRYKDKARLCL